MKEYQEKGGESNPEALHEMMTKATEMNKSGMAKIAEMRSKIDGSLTENAVSSQNNASDTSSSNLLNENLNNSKLDDLINNKKSKNSLN